MVDTEGGEQVNAGAGAASSAENTDAGDSNDKSTKPAPVEEIKVTAPVGDAPAHHREPRIHFRHGSRATIDAKMGRNVVVSGDSQAAANIVTVDPVFAGYVDPDISSYDPMFGRVPVSELEMAMVELGGAEP